MPLRRGKVVYLGLITSKFDHNGNNIVQVENMQNTKHAKQKYFPEMVDFGKEQGFHKGMGECLARAKCLFPSVQLVFKSCLVLILQKCFELNIQFLMQKWNKYHLPAG